MNSESGRQTPNSPFRVWMLLPALVAFLLLAIMGSELLKQGEAPGTSNDLPSTLIDRPAPEFALAPLRPDQPGLSTADLQGPGVKIVNVWASWCGPCRLEHPQIEQLAAEGLTIHGINQRDTRQNAERFLAELGDPYKLIGVDQNGRASIEWGVYGVPETFIIDGNGNVIYKHIGPIMPEHIEDRIRPAIAAAGG